MQKKPKIMRVRLPRIESHWKPGSPLSNPDPDQFVQIFVNELAFLNVFSALERTQRGWEYHISVSHMGRMPDESLVEIMKRDFDAYDFEEDNHGSTRARHFWKPLEKDKEGDCECKSED